MKSRNPSRLVRDVLRRGLELSRIALDPVLSRLRPGKAVLLHVGRSGSTVLGSMLGQHRRVFWDGEALVQPLREVRTNLGAAAARSHLEQRARRAGSRFHLISIKFYHLERYGLNARSGLRLLEDAGFTHFVVLRRRNLLRKLVSSVIASHTGRYHRRVGEGAPRATPVAIDPAHVAIDGANQSLVDHLDSWVGQFELFEAALADRPYLMLTLEDHVSNDPLDAYQRTCGHLGLAPGRPKIVYQPTNPFDLRELITNHDEVADALRQTRHAWMLGD